MDNQKNIFIACLLCIMIWLGYEAFLKPSVSPPPPMNHQTVQAKKVEAPHVVLPREEALAQGPRITIDTPLLKGSLALRGAQLDDLVLVAYHETTAASSPPVVLLSPLESAKGYSAYALWYSVGGEKTELPNESTLWQADHTVLGVDQPVTLRWSNAEGVQFQQIISIDRHYMVRVRQTVMNGSNKPITVGVRSVIDRKGPVETSGYMVLYEGPLGVFEGRLKEVSYKDVMAPAQQILRTMGADTHGVGWLGMTDKYWLTALIPSADQAAEGRFSGVDSLYRTESVGAVQKVEPGASYATTTDMFLGPKEITLLDAYEEKKLINHLDLAVDFGWFYFLTKPMFYLLSWLKQMCGSFGMAILVMTVMVKMLFFPLAMRSHKSMSAMKALQPKMQALRERFKDDKIRLNEEMMALYKKAKVNPASGCLPMVVQLPVFFALYKVLFISIEMRHAPFWGWIHDLSSPDPTSIFNAFGLLPFAVPEFLHVGAWPLLMGLTMFLQQKVNGVSSPDPTQRVMFLYIMPVVFCYMMANFPVGLVIYWTWSNTLTLLQQWIINRRMGKRGDTA